jgi:diguanylate cyclase (GGDEF)-like protein
VPMWMSLLADGKGATRSSRRCFVHPDGTEMWVERTYLNRLERDGTGDVAVFAHDITERRAQEAALRARNHDIARMADEFRMLADEVPGAVFRCDAKGYVDFHNVRWTELIDAGDRVAELQDTVHPDDRVALVAELSAALSAPEAGARYVELRSFDGLRILGYRLRSVPDEDMSLRRVVGSIDDVTAAARWRQKARHDPLTGLLNREAIEDHLATALTSRLEGTLAMFVDLDGFKAVNDIHGHAAGDTVLKEVANRLVQAVRPDDAVGRYGGDEFVIVCHRADPSSAVQVADRLERALAAPIDIGTGVWSARASIGATFAIDGDEPRSLLARADQDMYAVKRRHRSAPAPAAVNRRL